MKQKPKIGLALGSGASRGFAHIGVIKVLERMGLRPDYIAGSSIGSIIGALYAAGMTPAMMEGIANNIDAKLCYDIGFSRRGFMNGRKLEDLIKLLTRDMDFKDLPIPLAVTAVDLIKCERVIINEGKVYKGVRASISIPGVFQPVHVGEQVLIDGGMLERIPVNVVRDMGADIVIGVDVAFRGEHRPPENFIEIILQTMEVMELEIMKHNVPSDDIIIRPDVSINNALSLENLENVIDAGEKAAMEALDKLKALLAVEEQTVAGELSTAGNGQLKTMQQNAIQQNAMQSDKIQQNTVQPMAEVQPIA
jgi:NTE family protein